MQSQRVRSRRTSPPACFSFLQLHRAYAYLPSRYVRNLSWIRITARIAKHTLRFWSATGDADKVGRQSVDELESCQITVFVAHFQSTSRRAITVTKTRRCRSCGWFNGPAKDRVIICKLPFCVTFWTLIFDETFIAANLRGFPFTPCQQQVYNPITCTSS